LEITEQEKKKSPAFYNSPVGGAGKAKMQGVVYKMGDMTLLFFC
jgi:hypothetical protein